jgi:APA family basic amino acid/polyamine antiporter
MRKTNPTAERPFKAPFFPFVPIAGMVMSLLLMLSLPAQNWLRLFVWLAIGFAIYFAYGRRHSVLEKLRQGGGLKGEK